MTVEQTSKVSTGVVGLDDVLNGGLPRDGSYLVVGLPGSGKTTLALQFLLAGRDAGEIGVYVSLSETEHELRAVAASHGMSLDGIEICDLQSVEPVEADEDGQYTFFHPSEIELSDTTKVVLDAVERARPRRVVFDSLSEMRLLARDSLRYRRQILALKQFFAQRDCTVLMLDVTGASAASDFQLESIAHGVVRLEQLDPEYGGQRRRLRVQKIRGVSFQGGYHDYVIQRGGLAVFPRLVAAEHGDTFTSDLASSDIPTLDAMVSGGLDRGSTTLILGPSGVGKSTLAAQYVRAAAARGERASVYIFDEGVRSWMARGEALGMGVEKSISAGTIAVTQVDPAQLTPGEFASLVRTSVEASGARLVVIDSLNGYMTAMPEERFLSLHLHELITYLNQKGVVAILVMAEHGIVGGLTPPVEISYIADSVFLLRYFESQGEVRQAIAMVKRRFGPRERAVRELTIGLPNAIEVGRELREFSGILNGTLAYAPPHLPAGDTSRSPSTADVDEA